MNSDFGSVEFYRGKCEEGYTGPMCNVCEEEYGKIDDTTCGKCVSAKYFIWSALKCVLGIAMTVYSLNIATNFVNTYIFLIVFIVRENLLT